MAVVITLERRLRRLAWLARLALLAVAADLVAHDAIYRSLSDGPAPDRSRPLTEHGYWPLFLGVALALVVSSLVRVARRFRRLWYLDRAIGAGGAAADLTTARGMARGSSDPPTYHREFLFLWPTVGVATAALFLVQENLEHLAATGTWFGLAPLDGHLHPDALPITAAASLVVAAVGALVRWRLRVLEHRLDVAAAGARFPRPTSDPVSGGWWLVAAACRHERMLVRLDAGRAPPVTA